MKILILLALTGLVRAEVVQVGPVKIDNDAIEQEMQQWQDKVTKPQTQQDAMKVDLGIEDAFNQAKLRIEIEGANIFRPIIRQMEMAKDYEMVGEYCDVDAMFQCIYAQRNRLMDQSADPDLEYFFLSGTCAKAHRCEPTNPVIYDRRGQQRFNQVEFQQVIRNLEGKIDSDTKNAMIAYESQVQNIAQDFSVTANKIMKETYKCEPTCIDRLISQVFFNPVQAIYMCQCKNPITMDMSTQYLFKSPDFELFRLMKDNTQMVDDLTIMSELNSPPAQKEAKVEVPEKAPSAQLSNDEKTVILPKPPSIQLVNEEKHSDGVANYVFGACGVAALVTGILCWFQHKKGQLAQEAQEGGQKQEKLI